MHSYICSHLVPAQASAAPAQLNFDAPMALDDLLPLTTMTAGETVSLGARLASLLEPGDVLALYGDLGAGKTHLVRGICLGLGVDEERVTSPTFTLIHEYEGVLPVYHFDAYRLESPAEFTTLGGEEYFDGGGVCVIEWPERIEALLPARTLRVALTHAGGDERRISVITRAG